MARRPSINIDLSNVDPESFEFLCRDILKESGMEIERQPNRGPDQGVDFIASYSETDKLGFRNEFRVAVECKHFAKGGRSVREADVGNVVERTLSHNCNRYLLITSTLPSTSLAQQLEGITNNPSIPIRTAVWSRADILYKINASADIKRTYFENQSARHEPKRPLEKSLQNVAIHLHQDFSDELIELIEAWNRIQDKLIFLPIRPPREIEAKLLSQKTIQVEEAFLLTSSIRRMSGLGNADGVIQFCEGRLYDNQNYQLFSISQPNGKILESSTISLQMMRNIAAAEHIDLQHTPIFGMISQQILYALGFTGGLSSHDVTRACIMDYCNHMPDIQIGLKVGPRYCPHCEEILSTAGEHLILLASEAKRILSPSGDSRVARRMKLREQDSKESLIYQVAISFAGEDRGKAELLAKELRKLGVSVFYDNFEKAELWGEDLFVYLSDLYRMRAEFCVMLLSEHYRKKAWTNHEMRAAQSRAFSENRPYILPIRLDDTEIPGILGTTGYLRWEEENPTSIAELIAIKLKKKANA
jgi:hypothetical protein